jgi:hypothetical protein
MRSIFNLVQRRFEYFTAHRAGAMCDSLFGDATRFMPKVSARAYGLSLASFDAKRRQENFNLREIAR